MDRNIFMISLLVIFMIIFLSASLCDMRKPQPPLHLFWIRAAITSSSCCNRKNKCVISLPVVVLRLSLHTVSSSIWWEIYQQLSQSGWFKIGASVWLYVHIKTQTCKTWRKPLFCAVCIDVYMSMAVCGWRQCKKNCMNADISYLRWSCSCRS